MLSLLTTMVSVPFLLKVYKMIDVNSLDKIFVDDVLYLFDQGEPMSEIAYIMGCDVATVDAIVCNGISIDTMDVM
jgi:hypothetical protein